MLFDELEVDPAEVAVDDPDVVLPEVEDPDDVDVEVEVEVEVEDGLLAELEEELVEARSVFDVELAAELILDDADELDELDELD